MALDQWKCQLWIKFWFVLFSYAHTCTKISRGQKYPYLWYITTIDLAISEGILASTSSGKRPTENSINFINPKDYSSLPVATISFSLRVCILMTYSVKSNSQWSCQNVFRIQECEYLGHKIGNGGVAPLERKVNAVKNMRWLKSAGNEWLLLPFYT